MKVVTTGHPTRTAVVGFNYFWETNYMLHIWWSCKNFRKQFMSREFGPCCARLCFWKGV